jgi:hypothetical protein
MRRRTNRDARVADELRQIRLALIDLSGKADMFFSVLASIRNTQLETATLNTLRDVCPVEPCPQRWRCLKAGRCLAQKRKRKGGQ